MTLPRTDLTTQDRDRGLHPKYRNLKADGHPTDLSAPYFVLRLDGPDPHAAAWVYADRIEPTLP